MVHYVNTFGKNNNDPQYEFLLFTIMEVENTKTAIRKTLKTFYEVSTHYICYIVGNALMGCCGSPKVF